MALFAPSQGCCPPMSGERSVNSQTVASIPDVYVGVCVGVDRPPPYPPICSLIQSFSRLNMGGGALLDAGFATHAFVVIEHADGYAYRVDATGPDLRHLVGTVGIHRCGYLLRMHNAVWKLNISPEARKAAADAALSLVGAEYDVLELFAQVTRWSRHLECFPGAVICTDVALAALAACGEEQREWAARLRKRGAYPELLARALDDAKPWWAVREP
jgi:hypothetical protein